MISTLFDVITKLSSYAMVIFFAMFVYFKVTGKHGKYPYGKYALISLVLMAVFGTLFFNSPKGKEVIRKGNAEQAERTEKSVKKPTKVPTKSTESAVKHKLDTTHALLFDHQDQLRSSKSAFTVQVTDKRDTTESFKLTTVAILKAIKDSKYDQYERFNIIFNRNVGNGKKQTIVRSTFTKQNLKKLNLNKLETTQLKSKADHYYENK
ncbi:hypothetical protein ABC628_04415 [Lentilactobacillus otakiensis]|uniref:Uncharacterized protein n=1 Tax=Lentilactobacillus otakiensis DSM 19908 = JCM 15040 TaxID=1423780 RepID=S4NJC2_9LACO|nr:hypothetical protein [Lentilactobacillus otakiensis]KRL08965.1 hypothetical protein FD05_GL001056 [Lentilactobacillus otakiensis DSM 19908 = JCM 15040]MBZ3775580.1 hypothetical protein [Lentilactobacillus otakiensis]MDV3518799.1 hypothetical protein [Lentilactobacillus otakiensis]GAD16041.1 conserved hypothetical protein [Lentilactobacillus otakiensis DSM 19908 = JCM 15040]